MEKLKPILTIFVKANRDFDAFAGDVLAAASNFVKDPVILHNKQLNHYSLKSHKWTCIRYNRSFYFQNKQASHSSPQ